MTTIGVGAAASSDGFERTLVGRPADGFVLGCKAVSSATGIDEAGVGWSINGSKFKSELEVVDGENGSKELEVGEIGGEDRSEGLKSEVEELTLPKVSGMFPWVTASVNEGNVAVGPRMGDKKGIGRRGEAVNSLEELVEMSGASGVVAGADVAGEFSWLAESSVGQNKC